MFNSFLILCRIALHLIKSKSRLKKAQKLDKIGDIENRDKIVFQEVSEWAKNTIELTGSTVEVTGEENIPIDGAVVFIANHQGYMDIPALLGYIQKHKAFMSKIEVLKVPILSKWMQLMQCTFIHRGNMRQSLKAMHDSVDNVKKGYSLVIFPEGTRSWGGKVKEFKPGSFKLAFQSLAPIVPVTIDGAWQLYEHHQQLEKGHIKLTIHPPIKTDGLSKEELHKIPGEVQKIIEASLPPPRDVPVKKNGKPTKTPQQKK